MTHQSVSNRQQRIVAAVNALGDNVKVAYKSQTVEYRVGDLVASIAVNYETEAQVRNLEIMAENFAEQAVPSETPVVSETPVQEHAPEAVAEVPAPEQAV